MFPGCQVPRPTWEVVRFPNPLATGSKLGGEPDYLGSRGTWFVGNNENIIPKDALGSPSLGELNLTKVMLLWNDFFWTLSGSAAIK